LAWYYVLVISVLLLFSGCIGANEANVAQPVAKQPVTPPPSPSSINPQTATILPTTTVPKLTEGEFKNNSVAVEVNYRDYVDWFTNHNLNIRAYTPEEYVCGQYTVDMINASEKAGFKAYFAAVTFSDGTGHAMVSFKSTVLGTTSWYFFEPQTNKLMTPEMLSQVLNRNLGEKVTEVTVYGYFDDAGDKDPTTWRFAYPLFNKKY
jgi:hypothetical protein